MKLKMLLLVPVFSLISLLTPAAAFAATAEGCTKTKAGFLAFPTWYKYLNPTFKDGECNLDFTFPDDISKVLLASVEILLRISALVAVGFIIYGSFVYIISRGEPEKTKKARGTIVNALIGVVIAMIATGIVNFVGSRLS